ncbi:MAG: sulfite exporter TauE/SafE family protein [Actinomycetes bacterium]
MSLPVLAVLGLLAALAGSLGGIGGATLLVPALLLSGMEPTVAAPIGLMVVGAGSLASGARQLREGLVHHRIGLTVELAASIGVVGGALASTQVPEQVLALVLAAAALVGAVAAVARKGVRNLPRATFGEELVAGEWPGTLGGQYRLGKEVVPYQAQRVPLGMALCLGAGVVAGLSGVGAGFLKTPAMSEVMRVPVRVAAATTTFTLGLTAATGLLVYAGQGRVELRQGAAAVLGALVGGLLGARLQSMVSPVASRRLTGMLLFVVAAVVTARAVLA